MAQLAGIAVAPNEGEGGFLAAIEGGNFFGRIATGDTLLIGVRVVHSFGRLFLVEGEVSVAGRQVAAATLTMGVGKL
jgi:3-hydroxyacyl-[acyl-carrier-protein] dehydratase